MTLLNRLRYRRAARLEKTEKRSPVMATTEYELQEICKSKGLDWITMTQKSREEFVENLIEIPYPKKEVEK